MGIYGKVGTQTASHPNAVNMARVGTGELYAIIEETKLVQSAKSGVFAIVESTCIDVFEGNFSPGTLYAHMMKKGDHTLMEQLIASYVAAYNTVEVGHKFHESDEANDAEWEKLSEEVFGKPSLVDGEIKYIHKNPMKGAVVHYKVIPDYKTEKDKATGKKVPVIDPKTGEQAVYTKVIFLGIVEPDKISAEVKAKYGSKMSPAYHESV